jgi:hypothetical protein
MNLKMQDKSIQRRDCRRPERKVKKNLKIFTKIQNLALTN